LVKVWLSPLSTVSVLGGAMMSVACSVTVMSSAVLRIGNAKTKNPARINGATFLPLLRRAAKSWKIFIVFIFFSMCDGSSKLYQNFIRFLEKYKHRKDGTNLMG